MTAQQGLAFIAHLRGLTPAQRVQLVDSGSATLTGLVKLARQMGYDIDEQDLREAHQIDWQLRAASALSQFSG